MVDINSITGATVNDNGEFIKPGNYKLKLLKTMFFAPRNGGEAFIAEFEVLESDNPFHQPSSKATFYQKMSGAAADVAPGAIKSVCLAFMQYEGDPNAAPPQAVDSMGQYLNAMANNPQVFGPAVVSCEAHMGELKKTPGKEFCYISFKPWKMPEGWKSKPTPAQPAAPQTIFSGQSAGIPPIPAPTVAAVPAQQGFIDPPPAAPPQPQAPQPDAFNGPPPGTYSTPNGNPPGWTPPTPQ